MCQFWQTDINKKNSVNFETTLLIWISKNFLRNQCLFNWNCNSFFYRLNVYKIFSNIKHLRQKKFVNHWKFCKFSRYSFLLISIIWIFQLKLFNFTGLKFSQKFWIFKFRKNVLIRTKELWSKQRQFINENL